jgi:hypothetical protein
MMQLLVPIVVTRKLPMTPNGPIPKDGWGVEAPAGSRIISVGMQGNDLAVVALAPERGVKVWHPLLIIPIGNGYSPMLGRQIGTHLGDVMMGSVFSVFQDLPWPQPKDALKDTVAEGQA